MQNLMKAIYDVVEEHGSAAITEGASFTSRTLLLQKANPDYDSHKMNVPELHRIMKFTGDIRPLHAWADCFGFDLVARERPAAKPLMIALGHLTAECGDVGRLIFDAAEDNHISQHEKAQGEKAILEAIEALQVLRESLKAA